MGPRVSGDEVKIKAARLVSSFDAKLAALS